MVEAALCEALGLHQKDVDVMVNDGVVTYVIRSDDYASLEDIMTDPSELVDILSELGVTVADVTTPEDIKALLVVTVDVSDTDSGDADTLEDLLSDDGWTIRDIYRGRNAIPSLSPSISVIPTAAPSITGIA